MYVFDSGSMLDSRQFWQPKVMIIPDFSFVFSINLRLERFPFCLSRSVTWCKICRVSVILVRSRLSTLRPSSPMASIDTDGNLRVHCKVFCDPWPSIHVDPSTHDEPSSGVRLTEPVFRGSNRPRVSNVFEDDQWPVSLPHSLCQLGFCYRGEDSLVLPCTTGEVYGQSKPWVSTSKGPSTIFGPRLYRLFSNPLHILTN